MKPLLPGGVLAIERVRSTTGGSWAASSGAICAAGTVPSKLIGAAAADAAGGPNSAASAPASAVPARIIALPTAGATYTSGMVLGRRLGGAAQAVPQRLLGALAAFLAAALLFSASL